MSRSILFLFVVGFSFPSFAQSSDSLSAIWQDAKISGQIRHYWMSTINQGELKDFAAAALGGKIGVTSGTYRGLSLGMVAYTSVNLGVGNLSERDPATNRLSRYELGLFDVADPTNRFIALLGEAYLQYEYQGHQFKLGRMLLKTPMLNPQDGRMIPTLEQGVWYRNRSFQRWEFSTAYIQAIAPRSTARWYTTEKSIGWYPQGRNLLGEPGRYRGNVNSPGLFIQNVSFQPHSSVRTRVWNYAFLNVFNALYADLSLHKTWKEQKKVSWEGQYIWEAPLGSGGNDNPELAYFSPGFQTHLFGMRGTYQTAHHTWSAAFNRILAEGQYLFPREWGRDALYTFQKRERQEGFANSWSVLLQTQYAGFPHGRIIGGYGYYRSRDVLEVQNNKYAIPAYHQLNLDLFYDFQNRSDKLGLEFLIAYKIAQGNTYDNPNFILNKVDMVIFNLIVNYNF